MSASGTRAPSHEFRVLGPVQAAVDGHPVPISGPLRRRLLAGLLARAGEMVPGDLLSELLWGGPVTDAGNRLSTHVSRLRRDLELPGDPGGSPRIEHRPGGYALVVPDGCVDAGRFEAFVAAGRAASGSSAAEAGDRLREALALWRGQAFGDLAQEPLVAPEARRLEELRSAATEDLFDAELAAGRHHEAVPDIQAYARRHPFRERPHRQLMLALHRSGRTAEALSTYRAFREELDRALGLEPSAELQRLERDILTNTTEPRSTPASTARAEIAPTTARLPRPPTRLVGREDDVAEVRALVAEHRIVTLVGVGGVGKTRVAIAGGSAAERRFPDGLVWCPLAEVDPPSVAGAVAAAAGVGAEQRPLSSSLRSAELLLILDGCEHVIDVVAPLVETLTAACPRVTVLTTSREPLGIDGEHLWVVEPLAVPTGVEHPDALIAVPSVRLLVDRARAVAPAFAVTSENASAVAAICARLDGVPLAIELAASRLRSMSAAEVVDRLDDRLRLLAAERRTVGGRHQTLQATAAWSYDLLSASERLVFDRVSVFAGGFEHDAAQAVATGGDITSEDVADLLTALADKSMVVRERSESGTRYRLLEFLRRFGRQRLEQRGEGRSHGRRHARWFVESAERNEDQLRGPSEADAVARIDRQVADLRTAHRWLLSVGQTDDAVRLWAALAPYVLFRPSGEFLRWADEALAGPGVQHHPRYGQATTMAAACLAGVGQRRRAAALAEAGLQRVARDDPSARHGLLALAVVALYEGQLEACLRHSEDSRRLSAAVDDRYWAAFSAMHEVLALAYGGDVDGALKRAEDQRRLAEPSGNPTQIAWSLYARGEALLGRDPDRALALLDEAVAVARSVRNELAEGVALLSVTSLRARHGAPCEALRSFAAVLDRWRRCGRWTQQWTTLRNLVELLARIGHDRPAAVLFHATRDADTAAPVFGAQAGRLAALERTLARRLGTGAWEAAAGRAATMDADAVVSLALEAVTEADPSASS